MNNVTTYSNLAQQKLNLITFVSNLKTPEEVDEFRVALAHYLDAQLRAEMNKLWDNGNLTEEKYEDFRKLHERIPYRTKGMEREQ